MSSTLRQLYSEIEPFQSGWLKVSDIHEIYFEQSGKKDGKPVVFVYVMFMSIVLFSLFFLATGTYEYISVLASFNLKSIQKFA